MSCQQGELYAAENSVPIGRIFTDIIELQDYVDNLRDSDWWQRNFPQVRRIEAYIRPPGPSSVGSWHVHEAAGKIEMLPVHLNELTVLHEVCHVLAAARYGSHSHDPWFARTYLEAVYTYMGSDTYLALDTSFNSHGVESNIATTPASKWEF